jgi:hypothetical protein
VYSADETDVELLASDKVMWYSYVTVDKSVSVSVHGGEVGGDGFASSSIVMVRLARRVTSVGP